MDSLGLVHIMGLKHGTGDSGERMDGLEKLNLELVALTGF